MLYTEPYICTHNSELYFWCTISTWDIIYTYSCVCMHWYSQSISQSYNILFILQRISMMGYILFYPLFDYMSCIRGRQFHYVPLLFCTYCVVKERIYLISLSLSCMCYLPLLFRTLITTYIIELLILPFILSKLV